MAKKHSHMYQYMYFLMSVGLDYVFGSKYVDDYCCLVWVVIPGTQVPFLHCSGCHHLEFKHRCTSIIILLILMVPLIIDKYILSLFEHIHSLVFIRC